MAYFNHAFRKSYICSGEAATADLTGGLIIAAGVNTSALSDKTTAFGTPGIVGFFDASTYSSFAANSITNCCKVIIAGSSLKTNDKQGPFHGGYLESNKSKIINPKYVSKFWSLDADPGFQSVTVIGAIEPNTGASCAKEFICGETYYLRIDVKGTSPLRFAHHNIYHTVDAYGGCCPDPASPTAVDAGTMYGQWAQQIADSPYLTDFVLPILLVEQATTGTILAFYATAEQAAADGNPTADLISDYLADPASYNPEPNKAGLMLKGAYEDTKFGDCTFQPSDFYGKNPLQIFASEVDLNGDPCQFEGACVTRVCQGKMASTLGETVLREIIVSESYLQNFLATDLRIREITQGTSMLDIVDRNRLYHKSYLLHSVPRFNNPSGTFDNDQYLVEVAFPSSYVNGVNTGDALGTQGALAWASFNGTIAAWLTDCGNPCGDANPAAFGLTCTTVAYEPGATP
jgi:hypothetical protein